VLRVVLDTNTIVSGVIARTGVPGELLQAARSRRFQLVASAPLIDDDVILATALSGGAAYLVTGDIQMQRIALYSGVAIVGPRAFFDLLRAQPEDRSPS